MSDRDTLTPEQVADWTATWRANYARYANDPEVIQLMEAKLAAALRADGYAVPSWSADDRLKTLKARHVR